MLPYRPLIATALGLGLSLGTSLVAAPAASADSDLPPPRNPPAPSDPCREDPARRARALAEELAARRGALRRCSERHEPTRIGPGGLSLTIRPSGEVRRASFDADPPALRACVEKAVLAWRLPPQCGEVTVTYPISSDATR